MHCTDTPSATHASCLPVVTTGYTAPGKVVGSHCPTQPAHSHNTRLERGTRLETLSTTLTQLVVRERLPHPPVRLRCERGPLRGGSTLRTQHTDCAHSDGAVTMGVSTGAPSPCVQWKPPEAASAIPPSLYGPMALGSGNASATTATRFTVSSSPVSKKVGCADVSITPSEEVQPSKEVDACATTAERAFATAQARRVTPAPAHHTPASHGGHSHKW